MFNENPKVDEELHNDYRQYKDVICSREGTKKCNYVSHSQVNIFT